MISKDPTLTLHMILWFSLEEFCTLCCLLARSCCFWVSVVALPHPDKCGGTSCCGPMALFIVNHVVLCIFLSLCDEAGAVGG